MGLTDFLSITVGIGTFVTKKAPGSLKTGRSSTPNVVRRVGDPCLGGHGGGKAGTMPGPGQVL